MPARLGVSAGQTWPLRVLGIPLSALEYLGDVVDVQMRDVLGGLEWVQSPDEPA